MINKKKKISPPPPKKKKKISKCEKCHWCSNYGLTSRLRMNGSLGWS